MAAGSFDERDPAAVGRRFCCATWSVFWGGAIVSDAGRRQRVQSTCCNGVSPDDKLAIAFAGEVTLDDDGRCVSIGGGSLVREALQPKRLSCSIVPNRSPHPIA